MDESNDVQALEKISSEVDESQIQVTLSSQCIKAQAFLLNKLRKENELRRELCNSIRSANYKLEAEIKQTEQEISSIRLAQATISSGNVELKKQLLLAKDKKTVITERIENGVKKYEALWSESKKRFETVPFVQKLLQSQERAKTLSDYLEGMKTEAQKIYKDIETRKYNCMSLDQKRVIEFANYMINELPNKTKLIEDKTEGIHVLRKKMEDILKEQEEQACVKDLSKDIEQKLDTIVEQVKTTMVIDNGLPCSMQTSVKIDYDSWIPKLELTDFDLDSIDLKLDQVKKRKVEILEKTLINANAVMTSLDSNRNYRKYERTDEFILSPYIYKPIYADKSQGYAKRKLINILEDVKIDNKETYNIVSKMNPEKFQVVHEISAEKDKDNTIMDTEDIEEIDLTSTNTENIIIPPTQFLDITVQVSQESLSKKRVSFDLRTTRQINEGVDKPNEWNHTMTSQLDVSAGSEESFMKIKDLILKKHNLDLSPQFVYAKNNMLQKNEDDTVVTSKFFDENEEEKATVDGNTDNIMDRQPESKADGETLNVPDENLVESENKATKDIQMDVDEIIASSPKQNTENEEQKIHKPISGLLFTHGTHGIQDSLNVSISTTGYEDSDFPNCIDSSLLLSPKADIPIADNIEVLSQDVPNFLSGLRKTGLSFFGCGPSTSLKPDSSAQNQGNSFSFNFGGDDKKKRGGLFNMFN